MVSVCLPSDALSQHLPSYLGFSYLGRGVSLHGCSSKAQPLLLTLDEGYLLTATPPDLRRGVAPLTPPCPCSHRSLDIGLLFSTASPDLGHGVAPLSYSCASAAWHSQLYFMANRWGNSGNCQTLFWGTPKSLLMVIVAMKLKDAYSLEGQL